MMGTKIRSFAEAARPGKAHLPVHHGGWRTSSTTHQGTFTPARKARSCAVGATTHKGAGGYVRYAASASSCNGCPLKSECTKAPKGRWVSRGLEEEYLEEEYLEEEYLERVRAYRDTEPYRTRPSKEAGGVGRAAYVRGGQGVARF